VPDDLRATERPRPGRAPDLPAAVLWDMDGTLIDSEPYWIAAEMELVEAHGGVWSHQDAVGLIGSALPDAARILRSHGVDLDGVQITDFLLHRVVQEVTRAAPWQPGALGLLTALAAAGVPCALVTSSYRMLTASLVAAAPAGVFGAVVAGDDVTHGKPHPEPYLRAAALLGVDPRDCVAIEDSPPGIRSARASGARTIGVQVMVPVAREPGLSRVASLTDLTVHDLGRVARGDVVDLLTAP
jgi:HAD superfamily hydrolase (TIGR01509 family)